MYLCKSFSKSVVLTNQWLVSESKRHCFKKWTRNINSLRAPCQIYLSISNQNLGPTPRRTPVPAARDEPMPTSQMPKCQVHEKPNPPKTRRKYEISSATFKVVWVCVKLYLDFLVSNSNGFSHLGPNAELHRTSARNLRCKADGVTFRVY